MHRGFEVTFMATMLKERDYYVHTSMVDTEDKIRPAAILDLYQDLAGVHAEELGVGYDACYKMGLFWVVLYEEFETNNLYIPFGSKVKVRTWPRGRNRLEFEREYEMFSDLIEIYADKIFDHICTLSAFKNTIFDQESFYYFCKKLY